MSFQVIEVVSETGHGIQGGLSGQLVLAGLTNPLWVKRCKDDSSENENCGARVGRPASFRIGYWL